MREPGPVPGRVEVTARRTENAKVFQNPDGSFTSEFSAQQQRVRGGDGSWTDVDTDLVPVSGGRHRVKVAARNTEVADTASDAQLGKIDVAAGASVSFGLTGAAGAKAVVAGSTARYAGVRPFSDVELTATKSGLKETLVLRSVDAPTRWVFPLALQGLTAAVDPQTRGVHLTDSSGVLRAVIPAGWMEDSAVDPHVGDGAYSEGVGYSLVTVDGGGQALQVDLDKGWLSDPARQFPVRVDPSVTWLNPETDDTYVAQNYSATHGSDVEMRAGTYDAGVHPNASYVHFTGVGELQNVNVVGVQLSVWNFYSWQACDTSVPVAVYGVTQAWNGMTMKDWPGAAYGPELARSSFAYRDGSACPANWANWNSPALTEWVQDWSRGIRSNEGFTIRSVDNGDNRGWRKFATTQSGADIDPVLQVSWTPYDVEYAAPPGGLVWEPGFPLTNTQQGKIRIRLTNRGRDPWPANSSYMLSYHVYDAANTTELVHQGYATQFPTTVNPGQTTDLLATVNPLAPGSYVFRWDMIEWGVSWFSEQGVVPWPITITVPNVPPVVTGATPINGSSVSSLTPTLTLTGYDPDNYPGPGVNYSFQLCTGSDANSGTCWSSGWINANTWSPPKGVLSWNQTYYWRGWVGDFQLPSAATTPLRIFTRVPTSDPGAHLGADPYAPAVASVTPVVSNYTTATTDAAVAGVGPALGVTRTYNNRNPADGLFGVGWSSPYDMGIAPDLAGEGNIAVRYAD
ncbi:MULTISPECIES: DNRLRE domain-containing protein, partial [unclassified Frankia]|uniref:DNRLRE domain-containing protein n=1 Tax=unclassified Frankia TaxID=2632575 RepID=UPI002AD22CA9